MFSQKNGSVSKLSTGSGAGVGGSSYSMGDGSWELRVRITDLNLDRFLRVKSDLHIGGVMLKLVEDLGEYFLNH